MYADQVALPSGSEVLGHLGWAEHPTVLTQADQHVSQIALAARSYCRGRGWTKDEANVWTCPEDVAVVIVSAAARSLANPSHDRRIEAGSFNSVPGSAASWSLLETYVLNAYRLRAG